MIPLYTENHNFQTSTSTVEFLRKFIFFSVVKLGAVVAALFEILHEATLLENYSTFLHRDLPSVWKLFQKILQKFLKVYL